MAPSTGRPLPAPARIPNTLDNDNATVDALAVGETLVDTFVYTVDDGSGTGTATDTATLTITVHGTNDAPVATDNDNAVTEDAATLTTTGDLIGQF